MLDTDARAFGGWGRLDPATEVDTGGGSLDFQGTRVRLYLPSRSAQVYALVDEWELPEEEQYAVHTDGDFGGWVDDGYDTGGGGEDAVWW